MSKLCFPGDRTRRGCALLFLLGALVTAGCQEPAGLATSTEDVGTRFSYVSEPGYWAGTLLGAHNVPFGIDGNGITIGIIDDGVLEDHPDLNPSKIDCLTAGDGNPCTSYGAHGTLIAGIIDAIAPGATMKFCRGGRDEHGLDCLNAMSGYDIISISWPVYGGGDYTDDIQAKINTLYNNGNGVLIFVELDNEWNNNEYDSENCCGTIDFPSGAIPVSGVMQFDRKFANWSFTNDQGEYETVCPEKQGSGISSNTGLSSEWGDASKHTADVELAGPFHMSSTAIPYNGMNYRNVCGTSFATPAVAAVAALVMDANPQLTAGEVREVLKQSADDSMISGGGHNEYYGYGIVDAVEAVELATHPYLQVSLSKTVMLANGVDSVIVTGTVKDLFDNPLSGVFVDLWVNGTGTTVTDPGYTNGSGVAVGKFKTTAQGSRTVSVQAGSASPYVTSVTAAAPGPTNARVWGPSEWITNFPFWGCEYTVTFDYGVGPFTYEWRWDGNLITTASCTNDFNPGPYEGYHSVEVKVTDSLGRYDTDYMLVNLINF